MHDALKRIFTAAFLIAVFTCAAACGAAKTQTPAAEDSLPQRILQSAPTEEPEAAEEPEPTEAETAPLRELSYDYRLEDYPAYVDVVNRYYYIAGAQWSQDALAEAGLNYQAAFYYEGNAFENLGWSLTDLDGEGTPELFILPDPARADEKDPVLLELYTMEDGEAVRIFSASDRDIYRLTESGNLYNIRISSAGEETRRLCEMSSGRLETLCELSEAPQVIAPEFTALSNFE